MFRFCSIVIVLLLAGCRSRTALPPLPELETAGFAPAIRDAVNAALKEARSRPEDARAVGRLGMVLHAHDQRTPARACYERAALLDPKNFEWRYYLGLVSDGPAAAQALRDALRLRDYPPARLKLAEALLASGDSAAAQRELAGIQHPAAWFQLGRAANDPTYYEKALEAFPEYGAAMFALAQHYTRTGRTADAGRLMKDYERHRLTTPVMEDPLLDAVRDLNRGPDRLLREAARAGAQGDVRTAVELHLKALSSDANLAQAHINLISLYARLGDTANAEKHYRAAVALQPNSDEAHYNFGVLCYRSKRRAEAHAAFTRAVRINPAHADAQNNLGVLVEQQGRLDDAAAHFRRAIESKPDLRLARFHLGRIYANQGKYADAIAQFERAIEVDDEATPTYLHALGATLARSGDFRRAAGVLDDARTKAAARGQQGVADAVARDLAKLKR